MTIRSGVSALLLALTTAACRDPLPPPVVQRPAGLDADDLAVIKALFDDLLRPRRVERLREQARLRPFDAAPLGVPAPRFLVVDTTMAICQRDPARLGPQPGRCIEPGLAAFASDVVPPERAPFVKLRFPTWTANRRSIVGTLGEDVTYVSATLIDSVAADELLRQYPPGSEIVTVSAPGYPVPRMAVIAFAAAAGTGAARLERRPGGHWRVAHQRFMPSID